MGIATIAVERPERAVGVTVHLPGSKSLTVRAITLATLASGPSRLTGALRSDDTDALCAAVRSLGVEINADGDALCIAGGGPGTPACDVLDLGLGGAPARFSLALAALANVPIVVDGAPPLRERPMHDAIALFTQLGVRIEPIGAGPGLPLRVEGGAWETHHLTVGATATSQVVSALLLAATRAGGLQVDFNQPPTSAAYLELTIGELRRWGVIVEVTRRNGTLARISVPGTPPAGMQCDIAGDASSAVAAACACCVIPGATMQLHGITLQDAQPDTAALRLLHQAGVGMTAGESALHITAPDTLDLPAVIDAASMPDAVPSLAVLAACRGTSNVRLTGLQTLRVKECDRVQATASLIASAGGQVTVEGDDLLLEPGIKPSSKPLEVASYDDHRMAMAAGILGLWRGSVHIDDPVTVTKSWPSFWTDLAPLGGWTLPEVCA